ncbi:MAG: membrane protein insertion efficiency factor YidD [Candidatus Neomarinimicrobiota bacterium]|nr:membrane protein insertion efficiency factor YidD [Candidatus Neomarinimicrobiota bacterium]MEC9437192.1 membrane protein insertion efficiency factor YidD [Candidatus Neomarinimicrobiota bacterium]MEC9474662.1 membrane protein insertion efficiency factor YidD [Candidatus Neomarinimicrobiota bacterium]MED5433764.1 membrane protein insertion efficiency factor YidD [Candidatus Neomarinimicrobiota bacterium]|tara:strand:- start:485 stop:1111 length:627 start_codon:yes stop_codon:yes gene_type:complete
MKSLINIFLLTVSLFGQYPADSLFNDSNNNLLQKMFLYPITKWQRLSYNSDLIGCQYFPNCSLYGAKAIHSKGALFGSIITYDRIIRCNEGAQFNHNAMGGFYYSDGRLVDPVNYFPSTSNSKSPMLAAGLSAVVPGSGRVYAGRLIMDGIYGFLFSTMTFQLAQNSIKKDSAFSPLFIGIALVAYGGEIYGAHRTAKYYQRNKKSQK